MKPTPVFAFPLFQQACTPAPKGRPADSPLQPLSQQEQRTLQHLLERAVTAD